MWLASLPCCSHTYSNFILARFSESLIPNTFAYRDHSITISQAYHHEPQHPAVELLKHKHKHKHKHSSPGKKGTASVLAATSCRSINTPPASIDKMYDNHKMILLVVWPLNCMFLAHIARKWEHVVIAATISFLGGFLLCEGSLRDWKEQTVLRPLWRSLKEALAFLLVVGRFGISVLVVAALCGRCLGRFAYLLTGGKLPEEASSILVWESFSRQDNLAGGQLHSRMPGSFPESSSEADQKTTTPVEVLDCVSGTLPDAALNAALPAKASPVSKPDQVKPVKVKKPVDWLAERQLADFRRSLLNVEQQKEKNLQAAKKQMQEDSWRKQSWQCTRLPKRTLPVPDRRHLGDVHGKRPGAPRPGTLAGGPPLPLPFGPLPQATEAQWMAYAQRQQQQQRVELQPQQALGAQAPTQQNGSYPAWLSEHSNEVAIAFIKAEMTGTFPEWFPRLEPRDREHFLQLKLSEQDLSEAAAVAESAWKQKRFNAQGHLCPDTATPAPPPAQRAVSVLSGLRMPAAPLPVFEETVKAPVQLSMLPPPAPVPQQQPPALKSILKKPAAPVQLPLPAELPQSTARSSTGKCMPQSTGSAQGDPPRRKAGGPIPFIMS